MAKSALLEQYTNIWFDKQDYLEAERAYYEGKLGLVACGNSIMGRKNKSKQSTVPSAIAPPFPSDSIPPPPVISPDQTSVEKKRNDSECSNKSKTGEVKGSQEGKKNNKGLSSQQGHKQCPALSGGVTPKPVEEGKNLSPPPSGASPSTSPDTSSGLEGGSNNKAAQTGNSNTKMDGIAKLSGDSPALIKKISALETENKTFKKDIQDLTTLVKKLELRLSSLESGKSSSAPASKQNGTAPSTPAPAKTAAPDDDVDLFGSDSEEENEEAAKIREQRLAAYNAKKSKKPVLIAKSNIILDVKPWGDDTDMKEMEKQVRAIKMEGLLWGASKLAPLAYGINKLQISSVVEDELVSVDALTEAIQDIEEYVQSVDIAAFNKV